MSKPTQDPAGDQNEVNPEYINAPYHCSIIDAEFGHIEVCESEPTVKCDIWLQCGPEPLAHERMRDGVGLRGWRWKRIDIEPFHKYLPPTIHSGTSEGPITGAWFDCNTGELKVFSDGQWRIQQLSPRIPPWTTQPPTKDGWYWVRDKNGEQEIVSIDCKSKTVAMIETERWWKLDEFLETWPCCRWSGPIPEPPK